MIFCIGKVFHVEQIMWREEVQSQMNIVCCEVFGEEYQRNDMYVEYI